MLVLSPTSAERAGFIKDSPGLKIGVQINAEAGSVNSYSYNLFFSINAVSLPAADVCTLVLKKGSQPSSKPGMLNACRAHL